VREITFKLLALCLIFLCGWAFASPSGRTASQRLRWLEQHKGGVWYEQQDVMGWKGCFRDSSGEMRRTSVACETLDQAVDTMMDGTY
jgi:hypothetical protein